MAKGQLRGNKEKKKPKQANKPAGREVPYGSSQARTSTPAGGKKP